MTFPLQVAVATKEDMTDAVLLGANLGDDLINLPKQWRFEWQL